MLDHHIQKSILYRLAFVDSLHFSELQPDGLDNKLFTYHLKKVIVSGFVEKTPDGTYRLTAKGRRVGKGALDRDDRFFDRAYSILLLVVRRTHDDTWLLHTRNTQPLRGHTGLPQARPMANSSITENATRELLDQTGLSGIFTVVGQGYFTFTRDDQLESFIHATIVVCDNPLGELYAEQAESYAWVPATDFSAPNLLPTVPAIATMLNSGASYAEHTFRLGSLDSGLE